MSSSGLTADIVDKVTDQAHLTQPTQDLDTVPEPDISQGGVGTTQAIPADTALDIPASPHPEHEHISNTLSVPQNEHTGPQKNSEVNGVTSEESSSTANIGEHAPDDTIGDSESKLPDVTTEPPPEATAILTNGYAEEEESLERLQRQLNNEIEDRIQKSKLPPSDRRKDTAPVRLLQTLQYVSLLEDRVAFLEREVESIRDKQDQVNEVTDTLDEKGTAVVAESKKVHAQEALEPGCCELSYEEFQTREAVAKHVLTYLTQENFDWNRPGREPEQEGKVARVSINSKILLKWFQKSLPVDAAPSETCRIVTAPFKPFCILEQEIRDRLDQLQAELARRPAEICHDKDLTVPDSTDSANVESKPVEPIVDAEFKLELNSERVLEIPGTDTSKLGEGEATTEKDSKQDIVQKELDGGSGSKTTAPPSDDKETLGEYTKEVVAEMIEHFKALVEFMDTQIKEDLTIHKKLRSGDATSVSFQHLWHMFYPGLMVCSNENQAYMVLNIRGGRPLYGTSKDAHEFHDKQRKDKHARQDDMKRFRGISNFSSFSIDCIHLDFDGKDFGPVGHTFSIDYYQGEKELSLLPILPLRLCKPVNGEDRKAFLINRGQAFETLTRNKVSHRSYEGTSLAEKHSASTTKSREQIDSQVIIDFEHAYLMDARKPKFCLPTFEDRDEREIPQAITGPCTCEPNCTARAAMIYHFDDHQMDQAEREKFLESNDKLQLVQILNDEHRILLPNYLYGYVLRNLDWYRLDVDLVKAVDPSKSTNFEDLVLPETNKLLIKALVNSGRPVVRGQHRKERLDLVRGKGQGVIILLHGVPGTGKSSTAECMAEHLKCPLFAITCGNIGVTPQEVEENLRDMFYLAHKWNCVMLLDEADVFLQKRDEHDMSRNAVVSVFLRSLEYYSGILFLTTNKVGKFDEAFVSRIHMSLYYPMLNEQMTEDIWKVNLRRTKEFKPHIDFNEFELLAYARHHYQDQQRSKRIPWNGRQIRNAFQTAIALAEYQAEEAREQKPDNKVDATETEPLRATMSWAHFQQVADVSADFSEYLRQTHGGVDMFDAAYQDQDRYDERKQQANAFRQPRQATHIPNFGNPPNPGMAFSPLHQFQPGPNAFGNHRSSTSSPLWQQAHLASALNRTDNSSTLSFPPSLSTQPTGVHTSSQSSTFQPPPPQAGFSPASGRDQYANTSQNFFGGNSNPDQLPTPVNQLNLHHGQGLQHQHQAQQSKPDQSLAQGQGQPTMSAIPQQQQQQHRHLQHQPHQQHPGQLSNGSTSFPTTSFMRT